MSNITISIADDASDSDPKVVERRGSIAGQFIARKAITDDVSHACVVDGSMTVAELDAAIEESFLSVDPASSDKAQRPIEDISAEDLADRRATVALKRQQDQARKAREAAARAGS